MLFSTSRSGRWPLALVLAALAACADDPVAPTTPPTLEPQASVANSINVAVVTNTSGGREVGSLRWAASQLPSLIQFDPSLAGATITLDSTLVLSGGTTLEGPADGGITISGGGGGRVIHAPVGGTLRNVGITGGYGPEGSAVFADDGILTLEHTTVWGNHGWNAAIYGHDVMLINSTVSGNTGEIGAAGIAYATRPSSSRTSRWSRSRSTTPSPWTRPTGRPSSAAP